MARLNEPPQPVETVEGLKRRFVRQNREIARANSNAALKIRSLETEAARLLSENITLREENINLKASLEKSERHLQSLTDIRSRFESQLASISNLVGELGVVDEVANDPVREKSYKRNCMRRSPKAQFYRPQGAVLEPIGGLSPISEDKQSSRRTLNPEELASVLSDSGGSLDSPALGPPPVSQIEDGDPVKFDLGKAEKEKEKEREGNASPGRHNNSTTNLFQNLETRRKRKDTSKFDELRALEETSSNETVTAPGPSLTVPSLRIGAKRKLSVRDDDSGTAQKQEEFPFNRRNEAKNTTATRDTKPTSTSRNQKAVSMTLSEQKRSKTPDLASTATRKALGEKSVNKDPTSPAKVKAGKPERVPEKGDPPKKAPASRDAPSVKIIRSDAPLLCAPKMTSIAPPSAPPSQPPPATPANLDLNLFSPTISSEPSTTRSGPRDTPPPVDINNAGGDGNAAGRASRRARGAVSYAEPNLRDKMRRPGKELVDAVGAEERVRLAAKIKEESEKAAVSSSSTSTMKRELSVAEIPTWSSLNAKRAEPTSPLSSKSGEPLPSSVITDRKRRASNMARSSENAPAEPVEQRLPPTAATSQPFARKTSRVADPAQYEHLASEPSDTASTSSKRPSLEVYDFHGSSPPSAKSTHNDGVDARLTRAFCDPGKSGAIARQTRRVSGVAEMRGEDRGSEKSTRAAERGWGTRRRETINTAAAAAGVAHDEEGAWKGDEDQRSNATAKERNTEKAPAEGGVGNSGSLGRSERAAMRRRSMML